MREKREAIEVRDGGQGSFLDAASFVDRLCRAGGGKASSVV